jgi:hypothetical protein
MDPFVVGGVVLVDIEVEMLESDIPQIHQRLALTQTCLEAQVRLRHLQAVLMAFPGHLATVVLGPRAIVGMAVAVVAGTLVVAAVAVPGQVPVAPVVGAEVPLSQSQEHLSAT